MKRAVLFAGIGVFLLACNSEEASDDKERLDLISTELSTPPEEDSVALDAHTFIQGSWTQITKDCNEKGEECTPVSKESNWEFTSSEVTWSGFTHPYMVSNDTILIAGSPYRIASDWTDTIVFHAVKTNRFMQLVRKKS